MGGGNPSHIFSQRKILMQNECDIENVRCISTSDTFSILRGDACFLPYPKAKLLSSIGVVKIIGKIKGKTKAMDDCDYLCRQGYSNRKLTKIAWVQNYAINGGAEISNFDAVQIGESLGFDVVGVNLDGNKSYDILDQADVIIVNNLHSQSKGEIVSYLMQTKIPYVKYDHDCSEKDIKVFQKSRLNVFISPQHKQYYVKKFGDNIINTQKSICLPLAFNVDKWVKGNNQRIPNSVFVPTYMKCRDNVMRYIKEHSEKQFYVAGSIQPIGNAISLGEIHYSDMSKYYQMYESVLHLPTTTRAGERVIFEAILSGCDVEVNSNVGHASWPFDWRDERVLRPTLRRALYQFWHEIERIAYGD